jgi:hypothetical protein
LLKNVYYFYKHSAFYHTLQKIFDKFLLLHTNTVIMKPSIYLRDGPLKLAINKLSQIVKPINYSYDKTYYKIQNHNSNYGNSCVF